MATLSLHFDNSSRFYFEGEKLSAKLEVSVDTNATITFISVNFIGLSVCSSVPDFSLKSKSDANCKIEKEVYFDDMLPLFVAADAEASSFKSGTHAFLVEYALPLSLPSSLESPQGFVRYAACVIAEVGGVIQKTSNYFSVASRIDLNNYARGRLPVFTLMNDNSCMLSFLCTRYGPVRAFLHIPKRGYVPGELLTISAEVKNYNRLPINWVKGSLVQIIKYNCQKSVKRKRVVATMMRGCVLPGESQVWTSESVQVPAIPPSTCSPKRLINVKYKFYFLIKPSWQEKTISLKQNLMIGTVPLVEREQTRERSNGEGEGVVSSDNIHYTTLGSCIFGPHSLEEDTSTTSFSPLYPVYDL